MNKSNSKKYILIAIILIASILRLPQLNKFPSALYSDEVSQGYNAYSLLKTGHDEYGTYLPISFRSFGDWKPPLPTYLMIPTIYLFGLNAYGVRLPSALLGIATIWLVYLIVLELIEFHKSDTSDFLRRNEYSIALMTAFLVTISPWHILQSRSGMLVGDALFFLCLAIWSFYKGFNKPKFWFLSGASFILSIYSYYGLRVIVPLFCLYLLISYRKRILQSGKIFVGIFIFCSLLLSPLLIGFIKEPDVVFGRAKTVSIFYDQGIQLTVQDLIRKDGINFPTKMAQFFHNKPYLYLFDIIRRFGQHFDGRFLYLYGDVQSPFQIPGMSIFYLTDCLFLLLGLIIIIRKNLPIGKFLLIWIILSVLPAAFTFLTPSTNRTFNMLIPFEIIISIGIVFLIKKYQSRIKIIIILFLLISYGISFGYFIKQYVIVLPLHHASWWHYGYQELISYLSEEENNYDHIYISGRASVPYIFLLFYRQIDPNQLQNQIKRNYALDEYGFEHVDKFGKYQFPRFFNYNVDSVNLQTNSLLVITAQEKIDTSLPLVHQIYYPDQQVAFKIYKIN